MPNFKLLKLLSFLSLATTVVLLSGCGKSDQNETEEPVVRPVKLVEVKSSTQTESRSFPAEIEAESFRKLSFQQSGLVLELAVVEGQKIKKGGLIAKLDQRDFQNQYDSAKSQFDIATEEYERAVRLMKEDAIARSVLDQRKSQLEVAQALFDSADKALKETELVAPFSGVISTVMIDELARVSAGEAIVSLFGNERMQVSVDLPASGVTRFKQRENREAVVILDADSGTRIPAEFKEASLEADVSSQTFAAKFTFQPPEKLLILPGMSATILLSSSKIGDHTPTPLVPLTSILSSGSALYVWVFDEASSTVSKREIKTKDSIGEYVMVSDGIEIGDTIIGAGASYLSEGMEVRPWSAE